MFCEKEERIGEKTKRDMETERERERKRLREREKEKRQRERESGMSREPEATCRLDGNFIHITRFLLFHINGRSGILIFACNLDVEIIRSPGIVASFNRNTSFV